MPRATTVTTTQQVTIKPALARKLLTELQGYAAIATEMKALKEGKEGHSAAVLRLSDEGVDGNKYELEGFKVAVVKGAKDRRLDKDKLIKRLVRDGNYSLGAAMALIEDCTTEKPKKDHVRISPPGADEDDE
jgi:hypothetical protein